ncbi:MAG TPA: hypothetical protein VKB53_00905, partial [Gammaproteobacteria bacterium]|nr:hypothetical protein [Gammaproteobacteria bacterium]
AGVDIAQAVGDLVGDTESVPIRCAFTEFNARDGQVRIKPFVVDTTDTLFTGEGTVDLDKEWTDFVITPHPKDFSIFDAPTPLQVAGPFSAPKPKNVDSVIGRLAAAVTLGLAAAPIEAVIELIEPGTGPNSDCKALLNTSKEAQKEAQRANKAPPSGEEEESLAPYLERGHRP